MKTFKLVDFNLKFNLGMEFGYDSMARLHESVHG